MSLSAPASLSSGIVTETKNWPVLTAPTVTSEALAVGVQTAGPSTLIQYVSSPLPVLDSVKLKSTVAPGAASSDEASTAKDTP